MGEQRERGTILIVDDEQGPRESLRMILKPAYYPLTAKGGAEALEILRTTSVDLVTLDLNMPGIKGDELMRTIRRDFPDTEIIVITGYGTLESATEGIRYGIADYLQKPFDVVKVLGAVTRAVARQRGRRRLVSFLDALGSAVGRERDVNEMLDQLDRDQRLKGRLTSLLGRGATAAVDDGPDPLRTVEFLEVLAETIEVTDPCMRGHARRVAWYSGLLADRLCLAAEERELVRMAAFLHDVGKVGVPSELLLRPGPLAPHEYEVVKAHPQLGSRLVEPLGLASQIATAIHHHHEWWNGSGYPDGLSGEDIPLAARIIHVVDAFDAMSCDRSYRRALAPEEAVRELREYAGVQFDPELAKEFLVIVESGASDVDLTLLAEAMGSAESVEPSMS